MFHSCPYCISHSTQAGSRTQVTKLGTFRRKSDFKLIQRFKCKKCFKTFSSASYDPCKWQKKRQLNPDIFKKLASGLSQRRLAMLLKTNRKTIARKLIFLGILAKDLMRASSSLFEPVKELQFDDLETFEHTKLKPLSVVMAVEAKTRRILGFEVASMPAKGLLVAKALKKYGRRKDERKKAREKLFKELQSQGAHKALIKSDENPHYAPSVRKFFPDCTHKTYPGRRGCVVGQGELKAIGFDPLFSLNHSFAMLRANINRLFRRTWNTTKKPGNLAHHIAIYILFHNHVLIRK